MRVVARILTTLALTAVAVAAGLSTPGPSASADESGGAGSRAERLTEHLTTNLNRAFVQARQDLLELSRLPGVRALDPVGCGNEMAARGGSPRYTIIGAANLAGDIYCASPPLTSAANIADRPYFRRALGTREYAVGDFQIGRATGQESLGTGYPARDVNGSVNGVAFSSLSLTWLGQRVADRRPQSAADVLVVDEHGTVLARAGRTRTAAGTNLGAVPLVKAMLSRDRGSGGYEIARHRVASAFDVLASTGGAVHVAVSVRR